MNNKSFSTSIDTFLKMGFLLILLYWCFLILKPFIAPVLWGVIIAVTLAPLCRGLANKLGGKTKLSAAIITISLLAVLIVPVTMLATTMVDDVSRYSEILEQDTLVIPPPGESVKSWPMIGESIYEFWFDAAKNLEGTIAQYDDEIRGLLKQMLGLMASLGGSILLFVFAAIISGVFLVQADSTSKLVARLANRISEKSGQRLIDSTTQTVRNVTKGILGVAVIQAILAALGLAIMDVPGTPIIAMAVLILAIVQLSPGMVLIPVSIYIYSTDISSTWATVFLIWNIVISMMDAVLKPMFMGKGSSIPTLVIFLGAIGGMLLHGIVGLFVGAVILVVCYELTIDWMENGELG